MEANKISLKTITVSIAAILLIEAGFRFAVIGKTVLPLPALGIVRSLESILLVALVWWLETGTGVIGLSRPKILTGFIRGLIWSAWFGIAAGILFIILIANGVNILDFVHSSRPSSWQHSVIFLLVGGLIGPIAEEIFFRGVIYGFFRRWGAVIAIICSTVIFVFTHPMGGSIPVTQLAGGIVFAIAYEKEQNLMAPITIHCLGNLTIFSLMILI
jgi:membrane protease YdiL (CAAX protease family)